MPKEQFTGNARDLQRRMSMQRVRGLQRTGYSGFCNNVVNHSMNVVLSLLEANLNTFYAIDPFGKLMNPVDPFSE